MPKYLYLLPFFALLMLVGCEEKHTTLRSFLTDESTGYTYKEHTVGWNIQTTVLPTRAVLQWNYAAHELENMDVNALEAEYDQFLNLSLALQSVKQSEASMSTGVLHLEPDTPTDAITTALEFERTIALQVGDSLIPCTYAHLVRDYSLDGQLSYTVGFTKPRWYRPDMDFQVVINNPSLGILHATSAFNLASLEPAPTDLFTR